jgi:hypothetical protein
MWVYKKTQSTPPWVLNRQSPMERWFRPSINGLVLPLANQSIDGNLALAI